jgi:hypothetical protein
LFAVVEAILQQKPLASTCHNCLNISNGKYWPFRPGHHRRRRPYSIICHVIVNTSGCVLEKRFRFRGMF